MNAYITRAAGALATPGNPRLGAGGVVAAATSRLARTCTRLEPDLARASLDV